jgi:hypothetical protein
VPSKTCTRCGEFLPHWCASEITITRAKWTGKRVIQIHDRQIDTGECTQFRASEPAICDIDREAG